jgi:hypothetical protein
MTRPVKGEIERNAHFDSFGGLVVEFANVLVVG